ncbi:peptidase U32 family protein, partial [Bacillus paranthracis]|uniref:peptidase U32 family protein n=1 Tax=Bacillus paranthracis TaxID=2026186 RepID=UPI002844EA08
VLARKASYEEMKEIKEKVDIEIEAFVHGAMCIAYSGRCTLSNHMTARDSNRGGCCQYFRWDYALVQTLSQHKDSKALPLFQEEDDHFAMSPQDFTLILSI